MRLRTFFGIYLAAGTLLFAHGSLRAEAAEGDFARQTFTGKIGPYPVRLTLQRRGDRLTGSYEYVRKGVSLTLRGRITSEGVARRSPTGSEFELTEYDSQGRRSGSFSGQFTTFATLRGSWWKTERPKTRLSFHLTSDAVDPGGFTGSWTWGRRGYSFSIDLAQRGESVEGSYCAVTERATKVDCISPLRGTVNGETARVTWTSAYGGGSGTALLTRQGRRLRWEIRRKPETAFYAPSTATLVRTGS